jgi:hypothetical protein
MGSSRKWRTVLRLIAVLLRSLPYRDPDRLVRIFFNEPGVGLRDVEFSKPELDDLQTRAGVFEDVTPIFEGSENLTGAKQPERVEGGNGTENTAPGRERNWRATAWEIHPITSIEVGAATCEIAEFARRASPLDFAPNAPSVGGWSPPNPKNWSVWYSLGTEIEPYSS